MSPCPIHIPHNPEINQYQLQTAEVLPELFHNAVVRKTAVLQTLARPSGWATAGRATVAPGPGHAPMQIAEQFRQTAAFRGWTSLVWVNIIN